MSKGAIKEFLGALFQSEGGGNYQVINKCGYIGKYQFGESALSDLGYYVPDGSSPWIKKPNDHTVFQYQWKGTWTGKDGITSLEDFRNSPDEQDVAAIIWVRLLCSRAHQYGADQYEGKIISGITITHSGIVGAVHLKGFGTSEHAGVMQFLKSGGTQDPEDANGTSVSDYIDKFGDYDLGCCSGALGIQFVNKKKQPVSGVHYQVKSGGKVVQEGHSESSGKISQSVKNISFTQTLEVWVKETEADLEMAWKGNISSSISTLTLTSPHSKVEANTNAHSGPPGDHRRDSQLAGYTVEHGDSLWKIARQHGTCVAEIRRVNPGLDGNLITPEQKIKLTAGGAASGGSSSPTVASSGDQLDSQQASQAPQQAKVTRNDNGHPVAVAEASDDSSPEGDPKQKMFKVLRSGAKYGKKSANFSGPVAAQKARLGQPIYSVQKAPNVSTGECWKYVKIALLASSMVDSYPSHVEAKDAGNDLEKAGFQNILSDPSYQIASPYDAPEGAVIVYGTTDGSTHGHAEVVLPGHLFASDYISPNSRVMRKNETPTLIGKGRKVIGVWVK
ncbi:LysM peptidoglycan-binding domain-containing protein [Paraburkholderia sediminicola]|uniref:LysM peptidoglycan-binding domain-containing protein n=1 Tax=Paraburkholderia rhynchosiae TaxID=487049 RepID=A0ACC7N7H2_9BURK